MITISAAAIAAARRTDNNRGNTALINARASTSAAVSCFAVVISLVTAHPPRSTPPCESSSTSS